ncbi:lamin-like protein [Chenopodium quinoa]|uniref:Phytocyanin domain-containing protein n=1 Tax=Chenopodium quinoa TaxID=63459 RepID=A0A803LSD2_CHEQI|nr:lamin-like protein [Chenopodium quinoa]
MKSSILAMALTCALVMVMVPHVFAKRYIVGGNKGWTSNVNYTVWASDKHFYLGDWLFFVYDRNQMDVLEVNKTNYENCNTDHPMANWTTGAGRDVVPLNVTRHRYFVSGKGFCFGGMKLSVRIEKPPPPPKAAPVKSDAPRMSYRSHFVLPLVFAIGAVWDSFLRVMG